MESFLPSEIARLVLGYLEDHKCEEAYDTFLKTSPHLEECLKMREEGRKFRTQVMGLNLLDILYEYSAIFSLVQERLKKVDPETASSLKSSGSLLDKITFLLNATSSGQTMLFSITLPPGKSPSTAHVRKRLRSTTVSERKKDFRKPRTHNDAISPVVELDENVTKPSNLETTSLSSLPGNANIFLGRNDDLGSPEIQKTPKRKSNPNSTRRSRANSEICENPEDNLDLTALTKALLDNHELHEKIAENINKVIRTPDQSTNTTQDSCSAPNLAPDTNIVVSNNFTLELDNAIKKIVEETESDPVFENFLQDVICPEDETSDDGDDRGISETSTPCQSTPETIKKLSLKERLRSAKKRTDSVDAPTPTKIEHQNAVAIESIISIQSTAKEPEPSTSGLQKNCKETEGKNQNTQPIQTNTAENIQNFVTVPQPPIIITEPIAYPPPQDRLLILSSKMTGSGSVFTVQPAQFQTNYSDDILSMPTVIINDENNPSNSYLIPQKMFPTVSSTVAVEKPLLLPKTKNPLILPHPIINTNVTIPPTETITYTLNVQPIVPTSAPIPNTVPVVEPKPSTSKSVETAGKSVPLIPTSSNKKQKCVTPEKNDKTTPRTARSHIRALDFSTPTKERTSRKSSTSPKMTRSRSKTPKQSRSLFSSPLNVPIATRSPYQKLQGNWDESELIFEPSRTTRSTENESAKRQTVSNQISDKPLIIDEPKSNTKSKTSWDQDLRAHVAPDPELCKTVKKAPVRKYTKRTKTDKKVKQTVNKTEEDGKAIEAELAKENSDVEKPKKAKPGPKRKRQTRTKKTELVVKEEVIEIKKDETPIKEDVPEESKETAEGMRNMKPRVNKKCNMGSNTKKTPNVEDKKSPTDTTEESKTLTILSPSKMQNASKKVFVEQDVPDTKEPDNLITPDPMKPSTSNVIKVKRNLTPMLETPLKDDSNLLPITPRLLTPFGSEASFSNLIKQNCGPVDLSSLMTPSFPLTPCFPITPKLHSGDTQSSYASRPTDYSNSSSYYQPSDSEQTKKLDQVLIEETMKMESSSLKTQIWTSTPDKEGAKLQNQELSIPPKDLMPNSAEDEIPKKLEETINSSKSSDSDRTDINSSISSTCSSESGTSRETIQIKKDPNSTVIHITSGKITRGGKQMAMLEQIMKPDNVHSESDEPESPKSAKKLKERIITPSTDEKTIVEGKEKNVSGTQLKKTETSKKSSKVTKKHCPLLEELEMKRKRIIEELKNEDTKTKPKPKVERKTGARRKVEITARITRSKSVTRKIDENKKEDKKTEIIKKKNQPTKRKLSLKRNASIEDVAARLKKDKKVETNIKDEEKDVETNIKDEEKDIKALLFSPSTSIESCDNSFYREKLLSSVVEDEDVRLYISPDEEHDVTNKEHDVTNKEEDIVKGLKERGIHLIPKSKLPLKDEDNPNIINNEALNLAVSEDTKSNIETDTEENISDKSEKKIKIKSDVYLDEAKKIDVSKMLCQTVCPDTILEKQAKTQNESDNKKITEDTTKKPKEKLNTAIVPVNEIDEGLFHVKVITEDSPECIKIIYDESQTTSKTIKDYDFAVLERKFSAKVFIEELNEEQDRVLSVTPFIDLIPFPKKASRAALRPLEVLFNDIVDESTSDTIFSEASFKTKPKPEKPKTKTKQPQKLETPPKQRRKIISFEQYKNKQKKESDKKIDVNNEEDDLMTFAVTGTEKLAKKEAPDSNSKKRKAEPESSKTNEKRAKPNDKRALLKSLDVDQFLSFLHGPTNRES